ncbi:MAG: hypothetical protein KAS32_25640 [Candidatus Peribacteraceae bacterium]|nr:hypothetical protein [Candidatus Peribacteraceae bacterium]
MKKDVLANLSAFSVEQTDESDALGAITDNGNGGNMGESNQSPTESFIADVTSEVFDGPHSLNGYENQAIEETNNENETPTGWVFALRDIPAGQFLQLKDFGHIYRYQRVVDPADDTTDRFLVFHQTEDNEADWTTLNGLLTTRYVAASIEKFVANLAESTTFVGDPVIKSSQFACVWRGKLDGQVQYFTDETAKLVFSLLSGVDVDSIDNLSSELSVSVSNSYDGTRGLRLDYVMNVGGNIQTGNETREMRITDLFSLGRFSHKVIHAGTLSAIEADLTQIHANMSNSLTVLQEFSNDFDANIEKIAKVLKKDNEQTFRSLCENLTGAYRNLYYMLIVASYVLTNNYSIKEHMKVRTAVDKMYTTVFAANI